VALTALLVAGAIVRPVQAQRGRMMMGNYDPKTEITIQGSVEKVDRLTSEAMPGMGIHLVLKSGKETIEIHLGPASFVEKTMTFKEGNTIEVIGSKVTMMGKTVVVAREIKKENKVLKLRDEKGVPLWSRMQRSRFIG
jgi:DNA/RNA endonuclease YhcR with UshA esterase domain